jgi:hypothetical protein
MQIKLLLPATDAKNQQSIAILSNQIKKSEIQIET